MDLENICHLLRHQWMDNNNSDSNQKSLNITGKRGNAITEGPLWQKHHSIFRNIVIFLNRSHYYTLKVVKLNLG